MKTSAPLKNRLLCVLLCGLLIAGCLGLSAAAGEPEAGSAAVSEDAQAPENLPPDMPEDPAPDAASGDPSADTPEDPDPVTPGDGSFTVTYDLGTFGSASESVAPGGLPQSVPGIPEEYAWQGYVLTGWVNEAGEQIDPAAAAVTADTVYTARLERSLSLLLNTDEHKAYIQGASKEVFNTQGYLTRAAAATLFCNLLRDSSFEYSSAGFKDVSSSAWYAEAVERVNALGIAHGRSAGKFSPNDQVTRAEFVKMAASCDSLVEADCPFRDISGVQWAQPYIASAYAKGWILGDGTGKFRPYDKISRAEAVVILNRMLGRKPDSGIKEKSGVRTFCDVFKDHWAYADIIEAATDHEFTAAEDGGELWTDYTRYEPISKRGWISCGGKRYYIGSNGMALRGAQTIGGAKYRFDNTGAAATGFYADGSWKRYYKNGALVNDISNLGVVKGPYFIKVYKPANYLIVFAKDSSGKYNIPVRAMLTSCGYPTPTGNFYTPGKYRWLEMVGGSWAQWCTQIEGSYLFHSVPNDLQNNYTMWAGEYNNLGTTRSLGCIRLTCADAKWLYDNCALGTHVYISPSETSGPLKKPTGLKLPSWHTWDPTDPTAKYLCREHGCH